MSSFVASALDFHDKLTQFIRDHARFSDRVFGTVEQRGPVGPLKHMRKEAKEAIDQWVSFRWLQESLKALPAEEHPNGVAALKQESEKFAKELADLFLLLVDAMRRSNMKFGTLLDHAIAKLRENEQRAWPAFDPTKVDEAIEHVREPAHTHKWQEVRPAKGNQGPLYVCEVCGSTKTEITATAEPMHTDSCSHVWGSVYLGEDGNGPPTECCIKCHKPRQ